MTTILMIERHAPSDCIGNPDVVKTLSTMINKQPELLKKHGIKPVGLWTVHSEHLVVSVYESPSYEAFLNYQDEPELENWRMHSTAEIKVAMSMEEVAKRIQQKC